MGEHSDGAWLSSHPETEIWAPGGGRRAGTCSFRRPRRGQDAVRAGGSARPGERTAGERAKGRSARPNRDRPGRVRGGERTAGARRCERARGRGAHGGGGARAAGARGGGASAERGAPTAERAGPSSAGDPRGARTPSVSPEGALPGECPLPILSLGWARRGARWQPSPGLAYRGARRCWECISGRSCSCGFRIKPPFLLARLPAVPSIPSTSRAPRDS